MYIKDTYQDNESITSSQAVDQAMDIIYATLIAPVEKDLTEKQTMTIALAGSVLKSIAKKADAYDKLREHGNEYYNN
jgi:hypothetical protein|tara:strand:- start:1983 stop:2213 length:231 start_codon:yes stop_codon:yes gene_type:complete